MSYKTIAVCLDNTPESAQQLQYALRLAAEHNAHLSALHVSYTPTFAYDPLGAAMPMMMEWEASIEAMQQKAKANFIAEATQAGLTFDWHGYRNTETWQITAQARSSDLVLVTQPNYSDNTGDVNTGFYERFLLDVGRPVLFRPYVLPAPKAFDTVIVAWNGGREAARAMADALPILKAAKRVKLLSITHERHRKINLPDVDIGTYLARHGVKVEIEKNANIPIDACNWLLSHAADDQADLLVMGAYGHSRISELVLGGVTRSMLHQMSLPVLMSH